MRAHEPLLCLLALGAGCPAAPVRPTAAPAAAAALHFCLKEGAGHNCLLRDQTIAAHLLATSGKRARLVVAFPPENSGTAFWATAPDGAELKLTLEEPQESFSEGPLRGVRFLLQSSSSLELGKILLGSIRLIRDYHHAGELRFLEQVLQEWTTHFARLPEKLRARLVELGARPEDLRRRASPRVEIRNPRELEVSGHSLDGQQRFRLRLRLDSGRIERAGPAVRLIAGAGPLRLRVEAASTLPAYRGLQLEELLRPAAQDHLRRLAADQRFRDRHAPLASALRSLAFLSTERKFMAGSWRFLTYFGRDTLMSLWLLQPALAPAALESGLQSVLDRLSPDGEVAHEESLGDQAVLERLAAWSQHAAAGRFAELEAGLGPLAEPVYDYKMVDDNFMLPLLMASYLEDEAVSPARVAEFLKAPSSGDRSNLQALAANLRFMLVAAAPYAASGKITDLIPLKDQLTVGDWRDSEEGLGFGRFACSVNAYLVPAALRAGLRILQSPKIDAAALSSAIRQGSAAALQGDLVGRLSKLSQAWDKARAHFAVELEATTVRDRLGKFLREGAPAEERPLLLKRELAPGLPAGLLAASPARLPGGRFSFDALSLNGDGTPVEVMHTDDGFALLAGPIAADELSQRLRKYELRYPLGLLDELGVYVANPALSGRPADWSTFDRGHYHGTVVWSWHLILLQRGLLRQLDHYRRLRGREGAELSARLLAVLEAIAQAETRVGKLRASELWTVRLSRGHFEPAAYGHASGHADESNALQLWSDLNLAVDLERTRLGLLPRP